MRRKVVATLGILVATVAAVFSFGSPAQATVDQCPDGMYVCFYNYESFNPAGGIYKPFSGTPNVCHVLPTSGVAGWTNGKVYNASSSILLNWTGTNTIQRYVYFFDSNACSFSTDYWFGTSVNPGELDTAFYRLANSGWNDRIGSWLIQ